MANPNPLVNLLSSLLQSATAPQAQVEKSKNSKREASDSEDDKPTKKNKPRSNPGKKEIIDLESYVIQRNYWTPNLEVLDKPFFQHCSFAPLWYS